MENYVKGVVGGVIVVFCLWLVCMGLYNGVRSLCQHNADVINQKCGTNYTASDIFWAGDNIKIIEVRKD